MLKRTPQHDVFEILGVGNEVGHESTVIMLRSYFADIFRAIESVRLTALYSCSLSKLKLRLIKKILELYGRCEPVSRQRSPASPPTIEAQHIAKLRAVNHIRNHVDFPDANVSVPNAAHYYTDALRIPCRSTTSVQDCGNLRLPRGVFQCSRFRAFAVRKVGDDHCGRTVLDAFWLGENSAGCASTNGNNQCNNSVKH